MRRLFTFGCSFTHYYWPCWPEILDRELTDTQVYNYGLAGIGNVGISYRIMEADVKHKFTPDDEIMILWTSWNREDRILGEGFAQYGNVFSNIGERIWNKYHKYFWSWEHDIVKNTTAINQVNGTYKDLIKFQASAFPSAWEDTDIAGPEVNDLYNKFAATLPEMQYFKAEKGSKSFGVLQDSHPDILDHVRMVEKVMNIKISKENKDYWNKIHNNASVQLRNRKKLNEVFDFNPREFMK